MQVNVYWVRHGESAGNAGLPTSDHTAIPLTDKGREQAAALAAGWQVEPDYIFMSPFTRAVETARPTIERFPQATVRTFTDLQEFTYLSPATCVNTTKDERRPRVDRYWQVCDPCYVDGEGAESFAQLVERCKHFIRMALYPPIDSTIFVFSHMLCLLCMQDLLKNPTLSLEKRMRRFRSLPAIKNGECLVSHLE